MTSPTARTLQRLRRLGFVADVVERFIAGVGERGRGIRRDLWHFGDVLAVHASRRDFLIVQSTSLPNVGARLKKAKRQPELALWLRAGGRFEVQGWALRGGRWHVKVIEVLAASLEPVVTAAVPRKRRKSRWQPGELFGPAGQADGPR